MKVSMALKKRWKERISSVSWWRQWLDEEEEKEVFGRSSVGGVHSVDVAVQLVSEGETRLGGKIDLGSSQAPLPITAPGCGG